MKKYLLLFGFLFSAIFAMNAQDLSLSWDGEPLGDTVTVWGDPGEGEIVFHAILHNNTTESIRVIVRRKRLVLLENTFSSFCWGAQCYGPDIEQSPDTATIQAGSQSEDDAFSGHYLPINVVGTSIVEYTFFNAYDENQNTKVVCKFWASPAGIAEEAMNGGSISEIYPNPATISINLDYHFTSNVNKAQIRVSNLLGSVIKETELQISSNKARLDISDLENGIYFYSVLINGDVFKTKKLIVRH